MDIALTSFGDSKQPRICPDTNLVLRDELEDGIVRLTLNRPQQRNALSLELIRQLMTQIESMAHDEKVRVVILAGAGPAFCADTISRNCAPSRRSISIRRSSAWSDG